MNSKNQFTMGLAFFDALPVAFFGIAVIILGGKLHSLLFVGGAVLCFLAGVGKVLWKLILAWRDQDVRILGMQFRFLMPVGFLLMILGALIKSSEVLPLLHAACRMPAAVFFFISCCGIAGMVFCARRFDQHSVKGNWIEQIINTVAQGSFLLGVLFL